jgi:sporulation protein YlmC with PRC-barrel domain
MAVLFAALGAFAVPATAAPTVSASALLGAEVVTPSGSEVGYITDLAVDLQESAVLYAMVYADGGAATGEKVYGVPLAALRPGVQRDQLVLREGADGPRPAGEKARMIRASELLGKDVELPHGARAGEIADLAVDLATGRVHHAVYRPEDAKHFRLNLPLSAFNFPALGGNAVLAAAIEDRESSSRGQ